MIKSLLIAAMTLTTCSAAMAGSLLDPTRPASVHGGETTDSVIHVEAIIISDTDSWAIVNGTVVHRGDHVGSAVIEDISRYEVRYSRNGHSDIAQLIHSTLQVRRDTTASHEDTP